MAERIFLREVKLDKVNKTLLFYQNSVGNVSCVVWDAALVLTKYIEKRVSENETWLKGLKVIELGAGLGCVGIAAACYGAEVTLTDLPEVVPQLEKTIELNRTAVVGRGGSLTVAKLAWGSQPSAKQNNTPGILASKPDLILLSDCVYYEESLEPLLETLRTLCGDSTEIILSQEKRETEKQKQTWHAFVEKFYEEFSVSKVPPSEQDDVYASPDIVLLRARKKQPSS